MKIPYLKDYILADPWWLLLLLILPLLAMLRGRVGGAPAMSFPTLALLDDVGKKARNFRGGFRINLLYPALICAIIAMARPQRVLSYQQAENEGIAIVVACDVSLSMLINDFYIGRDKVDRLTASKRVLTDFIKGRSHDRIGIVAFSGVAYTACPPTLDHETLLMFMDRVQTGLIEEGTAIGSGIAAAALRLNDQKVKSKVMVVLTDGANNSGRLTPQVAARMAVTLGIKIYTVSIGTPGHHIIYPPNGPPIDSGRQEFDPETLAEVAKIGNGAFFRAENLGTLEQIFHKIDSMEKTDIKQRQVVETQELFWWFVVAASAFSLLHLFWKQTDGRTAPAIA